MIRGVGLSLARGPRWLLRDVSIEVAPGEIVCVLGPNGAGKSTLVRLLAGDEPPTTGEVTVGGRPASSLSRRELARRRAVLEQDLHVGFPFSALELVVLGRAPHVEGAETLHDLDIARRALAKVNASGLADRDVTSLSGGELQRVQLARVLAQAWPEPGDAPRTLILDEPTSALDLAHQHQTLHIVRRWVERGVGALCVLHDPNLAAAYADRVLVLRAGRSVAYGPTREVLTKGVLEETFEVQAVEVESLGFLFRAAVAPA